MTPEEEMSKNFKALSAELAEEKYTEDWYRKHYPRFPDHFYKIFADFSNKSVEPKNISVSIIE
jgi:hypothetical protein